MYKPKFNSVLVEIDTTDEKWGGGNDDSMLGKSYSKGKVIEVGMRLPTNDYPLSAEPIINSVFDDEMERLIGKGIIWNEGAEAGTTFDRDSKQYAFIYWWDIRGERVE